MKTLRIVLLALVLSGLGVSLAVSGQSDAASTCSSPKVELGKTGWGVDRGIDRSDPSIPSKPNAQTEKATSAIQQGVDRADGVSTSSNPNVQLREAGWVVQQGVDVLLIETTSTAIGQALTDLGVTYDYFNGSDFSGVNLAPYRHVFVAMDGGTVTTGSIVNLRNWVQAGGCLHLYGGTCWQEYATALNDNLLANDVNNFCWAIVAGSPDVTITNPGNYLAAGLPATYDFIDDAASFYQTRSTDAGTSVAAVNGDGYDMLMSKTIGSGHFDICINSPFVDYYSFPSDRAWLTQVVANMLSCGVDVLLIETAPTAIGQALIDLGVGYDYFSGSDFSGVNLTPYRHVFVAMDGGTVTTGSIVNLRNWVQAGGCLHLYGGTCWQEYATALNDNLLRNDVNNFCWAIVAGLPDVTITNAGDYLAAGLPATYDFSDAAASFYQTRSTDAGTSVAAVNGDGYDMLMSKAIGSGHFDICINSPFVDYYSFPSDRAWLTQVVANMLTCGATTAVQDPVSVGAPIRFAIGQIAPNPFNPATSIRVELSAGADLSLLVYDVNGRLVRTLADQQWQEAGSYELIWDGRDDRGAELASGVYHVRLTTPGYNETRKVVMVK